MGDPGQEALSRAEMGTHAQKIVVVGGSAPSLINFRGSLLRALRARGHEVVAVASENDAAVKAALQDLGVRYEAVPLSRNALTPRGDWSYLQALSDLFAREKPDVILAYTHKPVVYSALAKKRHPVRVYGLVTGLGYAFTAEGGWSLRRTVTQAVLCQLYRLAAGRLSGLLFQNADDRLLFQERRLLKKSLPSAVVAGSGVDLQLFPFTPSPAGKVSFLLIARLLRSKGVNEFAEAARLLKAAHPRAEFHLVGPFDSKNSSVAPEMVAAWEREKLLTYHGERPDVRPFLQDCSVFVLPSYYREGVPRTILEAMSTGRAVITTDHPGCRETVPGPMTLLPDGIQQGGNGFLVPPQAPGKLADAMRRFLLDASLIPKMGAEGRRLAEAHYDVALVNRQMLAFMRLE